MSSKPWRWLRPSWPQHTSWEILPLCSQDTSWRFSPVRKWHDLVRKVNKMMTEGPLQVVILFLSEYECPQVPACNMNFVPSQELSVQDPCRHYEQWEQSELRSRRDDSPETRAHLSCCQTHFLLSTCFSSKRETPAVRKMINKTSLWANSYS